MGVVCGLVQQRLHLDGSQIEPKEPGTGTAKAMKGDWLGTSADHALSGDEVHRIIRECSQLSLDDEGRYAHFRLDRMVRK
jgi:hypothetical protein